MSLSRAALLSGPCFISLWALITHYSPEAAQKASCCWWGERPGAAESILLEQPRQDCSLWNMDDGIGNGTDINYIRVGQNYYLNLIILQKCVVHEIMCMIHT